MGKKVGQQAHVRGAQGTGRPTIGSGGTVQPWRAALILIGSLAAAVAGAEVALTVDSHPPYPWLLGLFPVVGLLTTGVGLWLWDLRSWNRTGLLLVITGAEILLAAAGNVPDPWFYLFGNLAAELPIAGFTHLALAFPSGRLTGRARGLVAVSYAATVVPQIPITLLSPGPMPLSWLQLTPRPGVVTAADNLQAVVGNGALVLAALLLAERLRANPVPAERRALTVTHAYHVFSLASFPILSRVVQPLLDWSIYTLFGMQMAVMAGIPVVTAGAIMSRSLRRTMGISELTATIVGGPVSHPGVRDALAAAVDDPSLELLVTSGDGSRDSAGRLHPDPGQDGRRGLVEIQGPGPRPLTVVYDRNLIGDPAVVEEAGWLAALALAHDEATGELATTQEQLRESRLRIVDAADQERLRIARDLHDGVQTRLLGTALVVAGRIAATDDGEQQSFLTEIRNDLDRTLTELRRLVHGVMPALLVERGFYGALPDLIDRMPVGTELDIRSRPTLSATTSNAAYLITAEAVANAIKHAGASRIGVSVDTDRITLGRGQPAEALRIQVSDDGGGGADLSGSGLRGMADRAEALGGQLVVRSEPGRGTDVVVRLPCAS